MFFKPSKIPFSLNKFYSQKYRLICTGNHIFHFIETRTTALFSFPTLRAPIATSEYVILNRYYWVSFYIESVRSNSVKSHHKHPKIWNLIIIQIECKYSRISMEHVERNLVIANTSLSNVQSFVERNFFIRPFLIEISAEQKPNILITWRWQD